MKKYLTILVLSVISLGSHGESSVDSKEFEDRKLIMRCDSVFKTTNVLKEKIVKEGKNDFPFYVGTSYVEVDGNKYQLIKNSHTTLEFKSDDERPKLLGKFDLVSKRGTLTEKIDMSDYLINNKKPVTKTFSLVRESKFSCK